MSLHEEERPKDVRENLEVLVNDADSHEDTSARANGAHEISKDGER